jgi:hypothetical protein
LITFGDRVDSLCVARAALCGLAKAVAKELDRLSARVLHDGTTEGAQLLTTSLPRTGTILVRE